MTYTYEDVKRLSLPEKEHALFMDTIIRIYGLSVQTSDIWIKSTHQALPDIYLLVNIAAAESYMRTPQYALATSNYERAKAAFEGPAATFERDILDIWLECTSELTAVEKAMYGWDKI